MLEDYREIRNNILFCVPRSARKITLAWRLGEAGMEIPVASQLSLILGHEPCSTRS